MKRSKNNVWTLEEVKDHNKFRLTFSPGLVGLIFTPEIKKELAFFINNIKLSKESDNFLIEEIEIDKQKFYLLMSYYNQTDILIHETYLNELMELMKEEQYENKIIFGA